MALADKEHELVANLPHGDQRKLEVALLMALESQVFMFDEPTAGMNAAEAPVILDLIRKLKDDKSKTILLVEHKMDVVRELADRIIVLHNGTLVADGEPAEVIASPIVQEAYLGVRRSEEEAAMSDEPAHLARRAHAHRRVPHPARRRPVGAARPAHHAAGPQRRRQDHHAAHDHGPVACVAGHASRFNGQDITQLPRRRSPA